MSETLSKREMEVLKLLADGSTLKGVALELGLSYGTIGTYVARLYRKLGVNNRAQAVAWFIRQERCAETDCRANA